MVQNKKELLESIENLYKLYYGLFKGEQIVTEEDISNIRDNLLRDDVDREKLLFRVLSE